MSDYICELITFIKRHYLYFNRGINESFTDFYRFYSDMVENPLSQRYLGIIMHTLGIKSFNKKNSGSLSRWYSISFDELDTSLKRISDIIHSEILV